MGEVYIDKDNAVELVDLGIQIEEFDDKILIRVDQYKSGYECKICGGSGKIPSVVVGAQRDCDECKGKGATLVIPEISKSLPTLGTILSLGEKTRWRRYVDAGWLRRFIWWITQDELWKEENIRIRNGAKVLFGPHVGTMIPFKGNIRLKIMREHEPLAVIYGTDIDARQFMDFDIPLDKQF